MMLFMFFSSRRRHTRLQGDWSSDVCSSDLLHSGDLRDDGLWPDRRVPHRVFSGEDPLYVILAAVSHRQRLVRRHAPSDRDRKSTRLNSSHLVISYAVFCLKKKHNTTSCTSY